MSKTIKTIANYKLFEEIGSGAICTVYKSIHIPTGKHYAVKHINLDGDTRMEQQIEIEISILKDLSHPNIVK
jgi:serine/threonine protein kinase